VRNVYKVGLHATRLLLSLGDLVVGWLLLRQAEVAGAALDAGAGKDEPFYLGKLAAARFFSTNVLPELTASRRIIETATLDLMDLPEEAF